MLIGIVDLETNVDKDFSLRPCVDIRIRNLNQFLHMKRKNLQSGVKMLSRLAFTNQFYFWFFLKHSTQCQCLEKCR